MSIGTYILKCSNDRYYIGSTNDIDRRFNEHQSGCVKATKYILPVTLVFFKRCTSTAKARGLENMLKKKKSRAIIQEIIADGYIRFID